MAWPLQVTFQVHRSLGKRCGRLTFGCSHRLGQFFLVPHDAHALPPAAGCRLDEQRVAQGAYLLAQHRWLR